MAAVLTGALITSCTAERDAGSRTAGAPARDPEGVEQLGVKVLEVLPHDPEAFTQGLEMAGGTLYESTGIVGRSSVRAGPPGKSPTVRVMMRAPLFGEGITVVGRTLWQLTWQNGVAIERDARTLAELRRVAYRDDGWGLCHQREHDRLVSSNGSSRLTFRDPATLAKTGEVAVTVRGRPVSGLNELECVGNTVYANVLFTDRIVRIDAATGAVTGEIDAAGLLPAEEKKHGAVLNGVAAVPGTDQFLLTGKLWPRLFRVVFIPL
ncbi:glutaminyl-peptide cyclotransferase [Streptomyces jeddahensis]|uniref:Glutamine cyclotransferase n=1 Tax=Streptomyces jeddahensis TaxID=1716141 RepID=A0A177HGA5_9ACTN|nr:glutaminyl-peptide cyclotransferase [Streptomyces jeddahensis]OAH09620.1 glutamine cyclotransferase [Streptomyces jeddahensis]